MAKVQLPPGYCATCSKKSLDRVDLATEAEDKLRSLTKKMLVAFMIGDRDGALAEISYQLGITPGELSVAGPWESPKLDYKMAIAIAEEILFKFPDVLERLFEREGFYERQRRQDERRRQEYEYMDRRMNESMKLPKYSGPFDAITPAKQEFYIPPYTVKKNER